MTGPPDPKKSIKIQIEINKNKKKWHMKIYSAIKRRYKINNPRY